MVSGNFSPYSDENLLALESILGVSLEDRGLLRTAISTRAACNEFPDVTVDNERLEFLGDSVLKFLLSENLFLSRSDPEGKMTIMRTEMENNETLGAIASGLGLKPYLCLGSGESRRGGKAECKLLADALEAIIGAIYLDQGLDVSRRFVKDKMLNELLHVLLTKDIRNPVAPLQEISQKRYGKVPKYVCEQVSGGSHDPLFRAEVYLDGSKVAEAEGNSKKEAKKKAAKKALFQITN